MVVVVALVDQTSEPVQPKAVNLAVSVPQSSDLSLVTTGATGTSLFVTLTAFELGLSPQDAVHFAV